jgi:Mg2+ and Co2+ transporter CorA
MERAAAATSVRWVDAAGVRVAGIDELATLLARDDGWVWLDVPSFDADAQALLHEHFDFHPRALQDCRERNHVPKVHVYRDHLLLVLHAPEGGHAGHVHYLELDQLVGERYLVTVHGPLNPTVPVRVSTRETEEVSRRLDGGTLRPTSPYALSYAIVTTIVRHEEEFVAGLARDVGLLEQRVMANMDDDPEAFLEELYQVRHRLLTVRTMATQTHEVYGRTMRLASFVGDDDRRLLDDVLDQYARIRRITDGQLAFLHGVTEYYRARTDTKMTIAAERLAVIAALTLPITAVSSVLGMNVIVNDATRWNELFVVLAVMAAMSFWLLRWAKRHGWW